MRILCVRITVAWARYAVTDLISIHHLAHRTPSSKLGHCVHIWCPVGAEGGKHLAVEFGLLGRAVKLRNVRLELVRSHVETEMVEHPLDEIVGGGHIVGRGVSMPHCLGGGRPALPERR